MEDLKIENLNPLYNKKKLKGKRGIAFSLELLLVVAGIAVLLYLVVSNMSKVGSKVDVATASTSLTEMVRETQTLYKRQSSFNGLNPTIMIDNNVVPIDMVVGNTIIDQWGKTVEIATEARSGTAHSSFTIKYPIVPQEVCSSFVNAVENAFWSVQVNGTTIKDIDAGTLINPGALGAACNNAAGVPIIFHAGRN